MKPKRIDLSLFTEELRTLINAAAKIFPVEYSLIESGQNPNNYEYVRIMSGEHKREIYHWDEELEEWGLIGADDFDITWDDIDGKPLRFTPEQHQHTEEEISNLDKYTKNEVNSMLAGKADAFSNRSVLLKIKETVQNDEYDLSMLPDVDYRLSLIEGGYSEGHAHDNLAVLVKLGYTGQLALIDLKQIEDNADAIAAISTALAGKANTNDVNTALALKADKSTFEGHTGNSTIHVTATDKSNWDAKADVEDIPTKTSQLQNDSGFITAEDMPEGFSMSIGASHNNADVWLKVI